jgi:hypothetical protein
MRTNFCSGKVAGTYDDAWAGKHLAEAGGSIGGKRAFEVVLRVEAGVVVDTRLRGGRGCRLNDVGNGRGNGLGLGLVVNAWHCGLALRSGRTLEKEAWL